MLFHKSLKFCNAFKGRKSRRGKEIHWILLHCFFGSRGRFEIIHIHPGRRECRSDSSPAISFSSEHFNILELLSTSKATAGWIVVALTVGDALNEPSFYLQSQKTFEHVLESLRCQSHSNLSWLYSIVSLSVQLFWSSQNSIPLNSRSPSYESIIDRVWVRRYEKFQSDGHCAWHDHVRVRGKLGETRCEGNEHHQHYKRLRSSNGRSTHQRRSPP